MNQASTTKEAILRVCREIAAKQGLGTLTMRTVARECGIALGTLYNYYADKDALLVAAVESIWKEIFHGDGGCTAAYCFVDYVDDLFQRVQNGAARYPNFLTAHAMSLAKSKTGRGKQTMERYWNHMKAGMLAVLQADPQVDPAVFSAALSQDAFLDFVLDNILLLLGKGAGDCTILTGLVRRAIYR